MKCYNLRIPFALEDPSVGANPLNLGEAKVSTSVEMDEVEHVENSADDPHCMW